MPTNTTSSTGPWYIFDRATGPDLFLQGTVGVAATVPAAPTITSITPTNGGLSVAFTAGADGGATITNYQFSTDNGTNWTLRSPAATSSPIEITGLANGTTYQVQIRALNSVGAGTATASSNGTPRTTASAPTITGITAGDTTLSVAFSAPSSNGGDAISNYEFSTNSGSSWVVRSPVSTASPLTISGLANGTTYGVQLRAVNAAGSGTASATSNGTPTAAVVPTAPTVDSPTTSSVTTTSATLGGTISNTNNAPATERGIFWFTTAGFTPPSQGTKVNETGSFGNGAFTVNVTGLSAGSQYFIEAYASNSAGAGYSAETSFWTLPNAPAVTTPSVVGDTSFSATWSVATGATNYMLDAATDSGFSSFVSGYNNRLVGTVTSFSVTGLSPNVTYHYRVRAQNAGGTSTNSATQSQATTASLPTLTTKSISSITASTASGGGDVTSNGGLTITNRGVAYGTSSSPTVGGTRTTGDSPDNFTSSITGLTAGTVYFVRAYAQSTAGTGYGNEVSFTTACFSATASGLRVTATNDTNFTAAWDALAGADGYRIDVSTTVTFISQSGVQTVAAQGFEGSGTDTWGYTQQVATISTITTTSRTGTTSLRIESSGEARFGNYSLSGFSGATVTVAYAALGVDSGEDLFVEFSYDSGSTWSDSVKLVDGFGNATIGYNQTNALDPTTLANPYNHSVTATQVMIRVRAVGLDAGEFYYVDDIRLTASAAVDSYIAGYSNRTVSAATSVSVTGLTENVTYYFRVRGTGGTCTSGNSTTSSVTTVIAAANPPTVSSATNIQSTSFFANWNAAATADGYELDVATDAAFTSFVSGYNDRSVGNVTTFAVTNLSPITTYYYRLRSLRSTTPSGNSSTQTVTTAVGAPTVGSPTSASIFTNSATLGGTVTATNGGAVIEYGVYWSTTSGFGAPNGSRVVDEGFMSAEGVFTVVPGSLPAGSVVYYQAFARNSGGTGYTAQASFTTMVAAATAQAANNLTPSSFSANWAAANGATNYLLDVATDTGFTSLLPGYNNLSVGNVTTYSVTGLDVHTLYYYRVRAQSTHNISVNSATITVETSSVEPTVITTSASGTGYTTATVSGNVTSDGGEVVTNRGIAYRTTAGVTVDNGTVITTNGTTGTFTINLTGLAAGTTYRVKAFAQNLNGTAYGSELTFTTTSASAPSVTTLTASATSASAGEASGTVTSENGASVTNRGVVWGTNATPLVSDGRTDLGAGATSFTGTITGLIASQTYYARAFAQNSAGTGYGSSILFTASCFSAVVTGLNVSETNNNDFVAMWSALAGASSYRLYVSSNSSFVASGATTNVTLASFEFASYAGSEVQGTSAVVSANLISPVLITRGTGLTAVANGGRFNAQGWGTFSDATAAMNAGDFFEFTLTPTNSRSISITNITFLIERSGTAASNLSVRTSQDGYATDRVVRTNLSGTTGITISSNLSYATELQNVSSGITFRVIAWNGASGGSFGFEGSGSDIVVGGQVSSPSVSTFIAGYSNLTVSGTSASVTGLTDNTFYYFRLRAAGAGSCETGNSATQSVKTTLGLPAAPVIAEATNIGSYSFDANWSASPNTDSYRLDVSASASFASFVSGYQDRNVGDVTTFSVTNLSVPLTYYYRVRAVNATGTGLNSATQSVTTIASGPSISTPASASVTASTASLGGTIDNTNGASVTEWGIYWSTTSGFSAPSQGTKVSQTGNLGTGAFTVPVSGLNPGSTIYFVAFAANSAGTNFTSQSSFLTIPAAPAVSAANTLRITSFNAAWQAATGASSYFLDVSTSTGYETYLAGYSNRSVGNVTQFSVTNLVTDTTYYYRVRAQNASGTSTNSADGSATPTANPPTVTTDPVTEITLTTAKSGGTITNDGGEPVTNRGVVWGTSASPTVSLSTKTSDGSGDGAYTNLMSGLTAGQVYYARAYAQNIAGTGYGSDQVFTTTCFSAGPASISVTFTNAIMMTTTWESVTSASTYHLDVSTNANFGTDGVPATAVYHNGNAGQGTGGTWTETGLVQASGYLQMLDSTDALITPAMNFNTTTVETLTFRARTFGGINSANNIITVSISTNNGTSYTNVTTVTPGSTTLTQMGPIDVSGFNGSQVRIRLQALGANGTVGSGVADVTVTNIGAFSPIYIAGYSNRVVSGTSSVVTGLTQNTTYYLRARAAGGGTCASLYSPTGTVTTPASDYQIYFTGSSASATEHAGTANIPVNLSISGDATVQVSVVSGTATEGFDYTINNRNIVFTEGGATISNMVVTITDDTDIESSETIDLQLVAVSGAFLTSATNYTLTITDNEPSVSLVVSSTSIVENVGTYGLVINKSGPRNNVSGNVNISGTATLNTDYSLSATNFTLSGATTSATITVTVSNDALAEFSETIVATLTNLTLASTGFPSFATITITDDNDGNVMNPGDLAIVGFHSTDPDDFIVLALTNIPTNTRINFTDNGVTNGVLASNEGTVQWLIPAGGVAEGQIVTFSTGSVVSAGTVNSSFSGLSTAGDQIIAYQGSAAAPTFIYGLNFESTSTWQSAAATTSESQLPPGLTNGNTAVAITEADNGHYTGSRSGDRATLLAGIGDPNNWTVSDTRASITFNTNSFTITGPVPEIAVLGTNLAAILTGDVTPTTADGTDYGTISGSATKDHVFTVTNSGTASLSISGVSISGSHSNEFSVTASPSATVAAGAATTFTVRFDPISSGTRTALVTVANNDSDEGTYTFRVIGTATAPGASFAYSSTNVEENVGTVSLGINLEYAMDSTVRVDVASGATASTNDYSLSATQVVFTAAGSTSQTITVTVVDDSIEEAAESFTLRLVNMNNATGAAPTNVTFTIAANDPQPEIAVLGTNLAVITTGDVTPAVADGTSFGTIAVTNTKDHVFTVTNSGSASLSISSVAIGGAHSNDFSVTASPSASVASGATTTFTVRFDPLTSGVRTGLVTIANNDSDEGTYTFTIIGTATAPGVAFAYSTTNVEETAGAISLAINLDYAQDATVRVDVASGATATLGSDFSLSATQFVFTAAGSTSQALTITIIDDSTYEPSSENFTLRLVNLNNATNGSPSNTTFTILYNDAPTPLNAGDLAVVGYDYTNDVFAIVALTNIPAGHIVYFTDSGWSNLTNGFRASEGGLVRLTFSSTITAGTIIRSTDTVAGVTWETSGSAPGSGNLGNVSFGTGGDQLYAFQIPYATNTAYLCEKTFIIVYDNTGAFEPATTTGTGDVAPGLSEAADTAMTLLFTNASGTAIYSALVGLNMTPVETNAFDKAGWLNYINNVTNWTISAGSLPTGTLYVGSAPAVLAAPTLSAASGVTSNAFTVNWSAVSGASSSRLDVSTSSNFTSFVAGYSNRTVSGTSQAVTNLSPATTYSYRMRTVNAGGASTNSAIGSATTSGTTPSPAVSFTFSSTNVEETAGTIALGVNLAYSADATVRVDVASGATATLGSDFSLSATQFVFTAAGSTSQTLSVTIIDDSTYEATSESFTLRLVNHSNATNGSPSNTTFTIAFNDAMTPLSPGDIAIIGRDNAVDEFAILALTNIPAGHIIYFTDSGWSVATNGFRANETLLRLTINSVITAGTIIRTTDTGAGWTWTTSGSAPVSGSFSQLLLPTSGDQIYAFQVANPTNTVYLSDKTFVYVFDDTAGFENPTDSGSGNVPPGLGVSSNTAITFGFAANAVVGLNTAFLETNSFDKAGWLAYITNVANWTTSASTMPSGSVNMGAAPAVLAAPALGAASAIDTNIFTINWSAVSGASSYRLDVSTSSDFSAFVSGYSNRTVSGTSQSVTNLASGTTYHYRMRTVNAGGTSTNSATGSATTRTPQVPSAPTALVPNLVSNNAFRAVWTTVSGYGSISYRLDVSTSSGFLTYLSGFSNRTVSSTSQMVTGLVASGTYHYRVRATNVDGTSTNSATITVVLPGSNVVGIVTNSNPAAGPAVLPPAETTNRANLAFGGTQGALYDVYYSDNQGATWQLQETVQATSSVQNVEVVENNSNRFFRVIPTGQNPSASESPVVAVIKPAIRAGSGAVTFISPPIDSDRNMSGDFGSQLADGLANGTKAYALIPGASPAWTTFELTGGSWTKTGPGSSILAPGQGIIVQNVDGTSQIRFSGEVNDSPNDKTNSLAVGFNIIGISEGTTLNASTAFESAVPHAHTGGDPNLSDQVWIQNSDGSWRRLSRRANGTWQDTSNPSATNTTLQLTPGQAYYYIRQSNGGPANLTY